MDDSGLLSTLRNELIRSLGQQRYDLWVGSHVSLEWASLERAGTALRVGCPSQFEMQWLRRRLNETLLACCRKVWGNEVDIQYYVADVSARVGTLVKQDAAQEAQRTMPSPNPNSQPKHRPPETPSASASHNSKATARQEASGNRRASATFANFVVGKCNELAFQTTKSVAEQLGHYGPLLLFGPSGVGKTHLQQAVQQHLRRARGRIRSLRMTAEQFTTEFLDALHRRALPGFRQKYRSIDVLMIDDVHFLVGKQATLDELLYTIDTLHERGRQVILTCDRCPGDLQKVSAELVSRISGGLAIPIETPDYATRLGIVRQLASRRQITVNEELTALIATQVAGSARQLSGAMNLLLATSQAHGKPITVELARDTLAEFVQQNAPPVGLADIQRAVCQVFGVEAASLKSNRKSRSIAEPRMLAMWLARKYTRAALGEIGEYFGRRSHSTVISAQRKIESLVSQGADISVADRPCNVEEAIRQVESVLRTA